jgi:hypothetical protein
MQAARSAFDALADVTMSRETSLCLRLLLRAVSFDRYARCVEAEVLPHPSLCASFREGAADELLLFVGEWLPLLDQEDETDVYDLLTRLVDAGAVPMEKLLTSLLTPFAEVVRTSRRVVSLCALLVRAQSGHAAALLAGSDAFVAALRDRLLTEGRAADAPARRGILLFAGATLATRASPTAMPILAYCFAAACPADTALADAMNYIATCARLPLWRPFVVEHVLAMRRWTLPSYGAVVAALLDAEDDVELVVRAEREGAPLLQRANALAAAEGEHSSTWAKAAERYRALRGGHEDGAAADGTTDDACVDARPVCPLTLCPCVGAVVASDGRTYERGAIVEHMIRSGMWSPMTRAPLHYTLYARYDS